MFVHKLFQNLMLIASLVVVPVITKADNLFAELSYLDMDVSVGSQTYSPTLSKVAIGWQIDERFSAEFHTSISSSDDQVNTLSAEVTNLQALMLRYGSPIAENSHFYLALGVSNLELDVNGVVTQSSESYGDVAWGFGLQERLQSAEGLWVSFEFLEYYRNEDLAITSYSLGLRYDF